MEAKKVHRDLARPEQRNFSLATKLRRAPLGYRRHGLHGNGTDLGQPSSSDADDDADAGLSIEEWLEREYSLWRTSLHGTL